MKNFDCSGWATRNDLKCSDGRTIRKDAFKHNDGQTVPLVWNHQHNDPNNVLGHALLKNREEGVYAYVKFNETESGRNAKLLVEHGDITAFSIYANKLKQQGGNVLHGDIRELSLVLAGANPGAFIDSIIRHGEESDEEAVIYTGEPVSIGDDAVEHSDDNEPEEKENSMNNEEVKHAEEKPAGEKTIKEVFDTLTEEQATAVYAVIGQMVTEDEESKGGDESMKHNAFEDQNQTTGAKTDVLTHAEMTEIIADAKRCGSMKDAVLQHGIEQIDYLFPEAKTMNTTPEFIKRDDTWVGRVMRGVHRTPFSRIKSVFANITEEEARAKGYIKGKLKKEEVFGLLKRSTTPTTIYKKQKLDRDDVIDITDFDVVAWLKSEMRIMLDEEIARAVLVGDGRPASSDDKINELNIRPVWKDEDLFTVKQVVSLSASATADDKAKAFIRAMIKSRKAYKGSGNPILFTTEDMLTDCLLLEDTTGRVIYDSVEKLKTAMRVSDIVTVPVMEGLTREVEGVMHELGGIYLNLNDYNVGADKGGAVNMFDDFDIDYNAQKYLIETRCSGALTKPYSAVAIEFTTAA